MLLSDDQSFTGWQPPAKVSEADRVSRPLQVLQDVSDLCAVETVVTNAVAKVLLLLQDAVRSQLSSLRHESKAHQKAAVKRLLVQWHPDRNLEPWMLKLFQGTGKNDMAWCTHASNVYASVVLRSSPLAWGVC